ncbi:unnamed protein product [Musa acuminata var. zebrina]
MEHSTAKKTMSSMLMVALLFSALVISPSQSREVPVHVHQSTGGDDAASTRRLTRGVPFKPPPPADNSGNPCGCGQ